jgi:hypothetical protein
MLLVYNLHQAWPSYFLFRMSQWMTHIGSSNKISPLNFVGRHFDWHISFSCEKLMFGLTLNSWLWTSFVHPFFSFVFIFYLFNPFICFIFYPFFHPFYFIFGHMAKDSSMSCNILCHVSVEYSYKNSIMFTYSCSLAHTHQITIPTHCQQMNLQWWQW